MKTCADCGLSEAILPLTVKDGRWMCEYSQYCRLRQRNGFKPPLVPPDPRKGQQLAACAFAIGLVVVIGLVVFGLLAVALIGGA